jgi:hypothetical protein
MYLFILSLFRDVVFSSHIYYSSAYFLELILTANCIYMYMGCERALVFDRPIMMNNSTKQPLLQNFLDHNFHHIVEIVYDGRALHPIRIIVVFRGEVIYVGFLR